MQSKFFTLASSSVCCLLGIAPARAQMASPTPVPGYVRFWNMVPPSNGAFDLREISRSSSNPVIASNAAAYRYSSYAALPTGRLRLGVFRTHESHSPLKTFDLNLLPDSFFTVLISPGRIELINDTNDPKANAGAITVRNYFPGVTVAVTSGAKTLTNALAYGQSFEATDLPPARTPIFLQGKLPSGVPVQANVDVDFKESKRVTVLIIPDSYGRFRPRVTLAGKDF